MLAGAFRPHTPDSIFFARPKKIEEKKKPERPKKKGPIGASPETPAPPEAAKIKGAATPVPSSGSKDQSRKAAATNEPAKASSKGTKKFKAVEGKKK